jgi:hypothetical protein
MRVMLKFQIDCDADAAWRALHSPAVLAELYSPLIALRPMTPIPTQLEHGGDTAVEMRMWGAVGIGKQLIHTTDREVDENGVRVRILRDSGIPLTGPLASLDVWDHQMAVSPVPGRPDRTLWRDRLTVRGMTAPVLWPTLWASWQLRQARITALARTWAFDPEVAPEESSAS